MDKIYSRKRIRLPKVEVFKYKEKEIRYKRVVKICGILIITLSTAFAIINQLTPAFDAICTEKAKALATEIINAQSSNIFKGLQYEDLVDIVKDTERQYYNA